MAARAPSSFASLEYRWAASDLSLADGAAVTTWASQLGGVSLTEATTPPTYRASVTNFNRRPGVEFASGNLLTASGIFNQQQPNAWYVVIDDIAGTGNAEILHTSQEMGYFNTGIAIYGGSANAVGDARVAGLRIVIGVWNGASSVVYWKDAGVPGPLKSAAANIGTFGTGTTLVVAHHPTSAWPDFSGRFAEIGEFSAALTSTDAQDLYDWLNQEYGQSWARVRTPIARHTRGMGKGLRLQPSPALLLGDRTVSGVTNYAATFTASQPSTAAVVRDAGPKYTTSGPSAAALRRDVARAVVAGQPQTSLLVRNPGVVRAVMQTGSATIRQGVGKLSAASQPTSPVLGRAVGAIRSAVQAQTVSLTRAAAHRLAASQPSSTVVQRSAGRTTVMSQSSTVTLTTQKGAARVLAAVQASAGTLMRAAGKTTSVGQSSTPTIGRAATKGLSVSQPSLSLLRRGVARALLAAQTSSATLATQKGASRVLVVVQGTAATVTRAVASSKTASQPSAATLQRAGAATRRVGQASSAALTRAVAKRLPVAQPQVASLARSVGRLLTTAVSTIVTFAYQSSSQLIVRVIEPVFARLTGVAFTKGSLPSSGITSSSPNPGSMAGRLLTGNDPTSSAGGDGATSGETVT